MNAYTTRGQARIHPTNIAAAPRANRFMIGVSLAASVPGAVNASVCLQLRAIVARLALVLRLATRRPPRGLLAELL
jgi:hypothetical protein